MTVMNTIDLKVRSLAEEKSTLSVESDNLPFRIHEINGPPLGRLLSKRSSKLTTKLIELMEEQ